MSDSVAIIGSRGFTAMDYVTDVVGRIKPGSRVVSGGARGVDSFAEAEATKRGLGVVSYRPRRSGEGYVVHRYVDGENMGCVADNDGQILCYATFAEAAKRRNWWIVRDATHVVAFWDGMSSGTAHGIAAATRFRRPLNIWMEGDS